MLWGIEYRNIPDLSIASVGQKVFVTNTHIRHGILLLTSQKTDILGGTFFVPKRKEETSSKNEDDSDDFFSGLDDDDDFLDELNLDV